MSAKLSLPCALVALLLAACGDTTPTPIVIGDAGAQADGGATDGGDAATGDDAGGEDASPDGGDSDAEADIDEDVAVDVSEDTTPDVGEDTTPDVGEDTTPDVGEDTTPDVGEDTTPDVGEDTTPDVGEDTTPDVGEDTAPFVCGDDVVYVGQLSPSEDAPAFSPDGGVPTFTPWPASYDSGIQDALDAGPTDGVPVETSLVVRDATVIATSYNTEDSSFAQTQFWLGDGRNAIQLFLPRDGSSSPAFPVRVGQRVSLEVTSMSSYQGVPQIVAATDWELNSEGNEVYVRELTTTPSRIDVGQLVRATGTLSAGAACGGSTCYTLTTPGGATMTFRSASTLLRDGACVTYVGPVLYFAGAAQLDTINFTWVFSYFDTSAP